MNQHVIPFLAMILYVCNVYSALTKIPKPTLNQAIWLQQRCDEFACAWKGELSTFDALKSRKKALKAYVAAPVGSMRKCDKLVTLAERQKTKHKRMFKKRNETNPFAPGFKGQEAPVVVEQNDAAQALMVHMADSDKEEGINVYDITPTWLWKRFFVHRSSSHKREDESVPYLLSRDALQFYAGAGISAAGAATMGFDSAVIMLSKFGLMPCAIGLVPSLIVSLLAARFCYHTIVDWATKDVVVRIDSGLQELQEASLQRRLSDHANLVFFAIYQAKIAAILKSECDRKTIDESLTLFHDNIDEWSKLNASNREALVALQCDMKQYAEALKSFVTKEELSPDVFLQGVIKCKESSAALPMKKTSTSPKNRIATIHDQPSLEGIVSWRPIEYSEVAFDMQLDWCKACSNSGKVSSKICDACKGMQLVELRFTNGTTGRYKMPIRK